MTILAVDPGNTTGWAVFFRVTDPLDAAILMRSGAEKFSLADWWAHLYAVKPTTIIIERFSLYAHKAEQQINSTFFTCELIGITKLWADINEVPLHQQTAQVGKQIWTDARLEQFGYLHNNRHTRDAIRHGLTYMKVHQFPTIRGVWDVR